jgi:hypothetical protein
MNRTSIVALFLALSSAVSAQVNVPAGLTNIGVAAAVRGSVRATAPGQRVGRVIESGQPVYLNDHVTTGPDGRLQLLLADQTTFTIGPNSDMVLDEFVYDPNTGAGKVSARILKGFFRFVTGKIAMARPSNMRVTLPVGTIGIRGTMVAGRVDGQNADILLIGPGPDNNAQERRGGITVTNNFGSTNIDASGYGTTIRDGGKPSRGFRFSLAELDRILDPLAPKHTAGSGGPGGPGRSSGDDLALGGINSRTWSNLNSISTNLDQTTTFAVQQSLNGPETWSDVRSIPSGIAGYQGSGTFVCPGSGCTAIFGENSGTFSYGINVNFASRVIGGDGISTISLVNENMGINAVSFSSLNGKASYTFTAADLGNGGQGNFGTFVGTSIQFLKTNGQSAGAMQMNLLYNINYQSNTGTATGTGSAPKGAPIPLS